MGEDSKKVKSPCGGRGGSGQEGSVADEDGFICSKDGTAKQDLSQVTNGGRGTRQEKGSSVS